jgi:predicted CopG family antitoxin
VNRRRSRIVSFRCSPEEYNSLKSLSETNGARSVSEFTRSVAIPQNDSRDSLSDVVERLADKVQRLTDLLEKQNEHP